MDTILSTTKWKMPPPAKVYEALSALADERVKMVAAEKAEVTSSAGDKTYIVEWSADGTEITSNDNASYWQGYIGYPIIAVLLATGRIVFNPSLILPLKGILWKKLNKQFGNDYDKAVESVLSSLQADGNNVEAIQSAAANIFSQLQALDIKKMSSRRRRPPIGR